MNRDDTEKDNDGNGEDDDRHTVCELAQSKCTRTCHKSDLGRKLTRKMPKRIPRACTIEMHMDMSQEPFHTEVYIENAGRPGYHLDETPALNCYHLLPSEPLSEIIDRNKQRVRYTIAAHPPQ